MLVLVTAAGMHGITGLEVRAEAVDVGHRGPMPPNRGRQILTGQIGARCRVPRMPKVGMPVKVRQSVAPRPAKRQPGRHQEAAIPTAASTAPNSAKRWNSPASRSASGALAHPGTLVGCGGRNPRLLGADTNAMVISRPTPRRMRSSKLSTRLLGRQAPYSDNAEARSRTLSRRTWRAD